MHELQWPKLENFIPRDLLEHTRLLRSNFAKINLHVNESPIGAVPNYYYNVLSQQYMDLSEKLLAPPAEGELAALDVRARVHVAAQLELGVAVREEEEVEEEKEEEEKREKDEEGKKEMVNVEGRREIVQDEDLSRAENESSDGNTAKSQSQELEISSIPLDVDLENNMGRKIHVAIPAFTSLPTSANSSTPEILLEAYGVVMQNVQTTCMRIGTEDEKIEARRRLIAENEPRTISIRDVRDIGYIEWIRNDVLRDQESTIILEFRTPEQANEAIKIGLAWYGTMHNCRKYARNCRPMQCTTCQVYGHGTKQCASPPRCMMCSGQHSTSQCSNTTRICALCRGGHCANSLLCPKLAAERARVSNASLDLGDFWPVKDTVKKLSSAAQKLTIPAFPQVSRADRPLSTGTQNTVLPDLTYEVFLSQSKAIWPAVWQSCITRTENLATPSARESQRAAKRALEAVSGNQPKAEQPMKTREIKETTEQHTNRNPSLSSKQPIVALAINSRRAVATDEKGYW